MKNMHKLSNSTNNGARDIEFYSLDGVKGDGRSGDGFVEIFNIFLTHDDFHSEKGPLKV